MLHFKILKLYLLNYNSFSKYCKYLFSVEAETLVIVNEKPKFGFSR